MSSVHRITRKRNREWRLSSGHPGSVEMISHDSECVNILLSKNLLFERSNASYAIVEWLGRKGP
jgi:hypothetical protein